MMHPQSQTRVALAMLAAMAMGYGPVTHDVLGQDRERVEARLEESLPQGTVERVREMSRELAAEGIPPQLIQRKALEGAAKGVPPDRIVSALEAYSNRLRVARGLVGEDATGPDLAAGAEAVRRGVPHEAIRSLARESGGSRGHSLAVPLLVLGDLSEAGVPADRALDAVQEAMRQGAPEQGMLNFSAAVRRRVQQGEDPVAAFEQIRSGATERMRQRPDERLPSMRGNPGDRPMGSAPVPPGSGPPSRSGDGSRQQGPR